MNILIFAGAGTSIELNVPGMAGLAKEFMAHCEQWDVEPDLVRRIMQKELDVEHLIEEIDRMCAAGLSLESIGHDAGFFGAAANVRSEVEWFVQHAAERVAARNARLMWGWVLHLAETHRITIVTTNYDRAIELAANAEKVSLDDGFAPFAEGETARWRGFGNSETEPLLVKLHGSTDWFADMDAGKPVKLRHPMPLFGQAVLQIEGWKLDKGLVLPSRDKMLTGAPYPRLSQTFLNAADCCELALFVGSSLRDDHIWDGARMIADRAPVFVVGPDGAHRAVEGACSIVQHASRFLISTLPNAMLTGDPVSALRAVTGASSESRSILGSVGVLLDTSVGSGRRCDAVEEIDDVDATLPPAAIQELLAGADAAVARYVLGLVPYSANREQLIEFARSLHTNDSAFTDELGILCELLSQKQQ